jgi:uncharacterized cofD-like protein
MKNVVIVGGGTGTFAVTQVLKEHDFDLTKIVTVFDDGGSTGRLRDEFGFLPVGDLRQSLAALAKDNGETWIRDLLLYRFSKGEGLEGHNLGNLILTSLQDMTGSTPKALEIAAKIFRLKGAIYPITTNHSKLVTTYADGSSVIGEHELDVMETGGRRITKLSLTKKCKIYAKAKEALLTADYIIFGPGDLYASILPNLLVDEIKPVLAASQAQLIYIVNLMTRYTQTHNYTAQEHVHEMEAYAGKYMDYVLVNTGSIAPAIEKKYAKYNEFPVVNDLQGMKPRSIIRGDFASSVKLKRQKGDTLPRALMRHDQAKLAKALLSILK